MLEPEPDRIIIRNLRVRCIIGVNPEERENKQELVIGLDMYTDLAAAGATDDLNDTVDYKAVKNRILAEIEDSRFFLIERVAAKNAEIALEHPRVIKAAVTVDKPGALRFAESVAVAVTRARP